MIVSMLFGEWREYTEMLVLSTEMQHLADDIDNACAGPAITTCGPDGYKAISDLCTHIREAYDILIRDMSETITPSASLEEGE